MKPAAALAGYLAFVFGGAALLSPWLYLAAQQLADSPVFRELAANPFHRYLNRCLLVLALVGMYPFIRALGVKSWQEAGVSFSKGWRREWFIGFAWGLGSLLVVASMAILSGQRVWNFDHKMSEFLIHLMNAIFGALLVAVLEELLFRGAIFSGLRKIHGFLPSLVVSSSIYALVHFFSKPAAPETINWTTGFGVLGEMLRGFVDVHQLIPGFINLTLAGIILVFLLVRKGTLFMAIGLHAGWIFWLKSYNFFTHPTQEGNAWWWGSSKLIDGWSAFLVLFCMGIGFYPRRKEQVDGIQN